MADFQTLSGLTQLGKIPVDMTLDGLAAIRQSQQADDIGLQELMRKQALSRQMDPLQVAHQQLVNKGLTLGNEKSDYELKSLGRKDQMESELWDQTKASKLAQLLDQEGEAKANMFGQQLYQKLQGTRPGTPEHRAIMGALETTKGWVEKRRDASIAEASQRRLFEQQQAMEDKRNAGKLAVAKARADTTAAMATAKAPRDYVQLAATLAEKIRQEQDPEVKAELLQHLQYANLMAERLNPAMSKPVLTPRPGMPLAAPNTAPMPAMPGSAPQAQKPTTSNW